MINMKDLIKKQSIMVREQTGMIKEKSTWPDKEKYQDDIEEGRVNQSKVNQSFTRVIAFVRKEAKKLNDDDLYAMTQKLAKWLK